MKTGTHALSSYSSKLLFVFFCVLLIGGVLADSLSTWLHFHGSVFWRASFVFRAGMGIDITGILIMHIQRWPNYARWLLTVWLVSLLLLWGGYAYRPIAGMDSYMTATIHLYKMIYPLLLFVAMRIFLGRDRFLVGRLFKVLDFILAVYLAFIFLGLFTGNEMFRTYWNGLRPGFKGIIMTQNEATGTVLVAIFWFGLRYFSGQRHVLFFVVSILAALILGTKGALLACVPLVGGILWARYGLLKMMPVFGWVVGVFSIISLLAYQYSETIHASVALFLNYMTAHSMGDSFHDVITLLMSGRNLRVESLLSTLANDFPIGFLVSGMPISYGSVEIDPVDAFLRGGLLFLLLLLVVYWKMFRFSGGSGGKRYKLVLFVVWMGVSFTGGHLWMAETTAPMLIIALAYAGQMEWRHSSLYENAVQGERTPLRL
ncbi:MAG TPA: hypothetical protein ENI68_08695 [Gammaproteobacteria bacterium]|nr:hypothetical protein [Gammaproteobacteria bacterium]